MRKRYTIHFDSQDRSRFGETTPSGYTLLMPRILRNVVSAKLISAEIPTSYYIFKSSYGNTSMRVSLYTGSGTLTQTVTLPDGNYGSSITSVLKASLEAAFPTYTFDCTVSLTTMKLSIEESGGNDVQVHTDDATDSINFRSTLPYYLGFSYDTLSKGAPLVADHIINLNPATYVILDIDELNQNNEGGLYGSRHSPRGIFAKLPINTNSFEYCFWEPDNPVEVLMNPMIPRLDRLTVSWRFHNLEAVDFDNFEHSFTIEFEVEEEDPDRKVEDAKSQTNVRHVVVPQDACRSHNDASKTNLYIMPQGEDYPQVHAGGSLRSVAFMACFATLGIGTFCYYRAKAS